MPGPMDHFLWRLERIEKDLEKVSHRLRVVFKIQFDTETGQQRPAQRSDFPFGRAIISDENVLRVRGNFFGSDEDVGLFRFWELRNSAENLCWPCSSAPQLSEGLRLPEPVTGTLGVWYYLPNAENGKTDAVSESMERTLADFEAIFDTCESAPDTVRLSLRHCYKMNEWAAVLLYLALVHAHPTLKLLGASLPQPHVASPLENGDCGSHKTVEVAPGHEGWRDQARHAENDLVLRFSPGQVDVVTLTSYAFEVLRQIAHGNWDGTMRHQHADVPLSDVVLSDAYGQGEFEAKPVAGAEATPEVRVPELQISAAKPSEAAAGPGKGEGDGEADTTKAGKRRGRKVDKRTIRRADFAKPLRESGESWPSIFAAYEKKHPRDIDTNEDVIRQAFKRQYPELFEKLKTKPPTE